LTGERAISPFQQNSSFILMWGKMGVVVQVRLYDKEFCSFFWNFNRKFSDQLIIKRGGI